MGQRDAVVGFDSDEIEIASDFFRTPHAPLDEVEEGDITDSEIASDAGSG